LALPTPSRPRSATAAAGRLRRWRLPAHLAAGLLVLLSAGCAGQRKPAAPESTERTLAWVAASAAEPSAVAVRGCLEGALRTSFALVDFRSARWSDAKVRDALTHEVTLASLRAQRLHEGDLWVQGHDPATVAADDLRWCLSLDHVRLPDSPPLHSCLRATQAAAALSLARHYGRSQTQALEQLVAAAPAAAATPGLEELADAVYGAPSEAAELQLRVQVFSRCAARNP
jgi:hypothetical protein